MSAVRDETIWLLRRLADLRGDVRRFGDHARRLNCTTVGGHLDEALELIETAEGELTAIVVDTK